MAAFTATGQRAPQAGSAGYAAAGGSRSHSCRGTAFKPGPRRAAAASVVAVVSVLSVLAALVLQPADGADLTDPDAGTDSFAANFATGDNVFTIGDDVVDNEPQGGTELSHLHKVLPAFLHPWLPHEYSDPADEHAIDAYPLASKVPFLKTGLNILKAVGGPTMDHGNPTVANYRVHLARLSGPVAHKIPLHSVGVDYLRLVARSLWNCDPVSSERTIVRFLRNESHRKAIRDARGGGGWPEFRTCAATGAVTDGMVTNRLYYIGVPPAIQGTLSPGERRALCDYAFSCREPEGAGRFAATSEAEAGTTLVEAVRRFRLLNTLQWGYSVPRALLVSLRTNTLHVLRLYYEGIQEDLDQSPITLAAAPEAPEALAARPTAEDVRIALLTETGAPGPLEAARVAHEALRGAVDSLITSRTAVRVIDALTEAEGRDQVEAALRQGTRERCQDWREEEGRGGDSVERAWMCMDGMVADVDRALTEARREKAAARGPGASLLAGVLKALLACRHPTPEPSAAGFFNNDQAEISQREYADRCLYGAGGLEDFFEQAHEAELARRSGWDLTAGTDLVRGLVKAARDLVPLCEQSASMARKVGAALVQHGRHLGMLSQVLTGLSGRPDLPCDRFGSFVECAVADMLSPNLFLATNLELTLASDRNTQAKDDLVRTVLGEPDRPFSAADWARGPDTITETEMHHLRRYTGSDFLPMNGFLRQLGLVSDPLQKVGNVAAAVSALSKLPPRYKYADGKTRVRFTSLGRQWELDQFLTTGVLVEYGLLSTSVRANWAWNGNFKLVIPDACQATSAAEGDWCVSSGRYVSGKEPNKWWWWESISVHPEEEEVLYMPGTLIVATHDIPRDGLGQKTVEMIEVLQIGI